MDGFKFRVVPFILSLTPVFTSHGYSERDCLVFVRALSAGEV